MRRTLTLLVAAVGVLGPVGCRPHGTPADTAAREIAQANAHLQGTWTLTQFQPDMALEPMFAQLLAVQMGRLTVRFDANQAFVTGIGVNTQRAYRIDKAEGSQIHLTLIEDTGATYQVVGDLTPDTVFFRSETDPWRGRGVLKRGAPMGQLGW